MKKKAGRKRRGFDSKLPNTIGPSRVELRSRLGDAADTLGGETARRLSILWKMLAEMHRANDVMAMVHGQRGSVALFQNLLDAIANRDVKFFEDVAETLENIGSGTPFERQWSALAAYISWKRSQDEDWRPTKKELRDIYPGVGEKALAKILRASGIEIRNPRGGRPTSPIVSRTGRG